MSAYQLTVLFFSVALAAPCMWEKPQRPIEEVKKPTSQAAKSSTPPALPRIEVGDPPPDQRISPDPLPNILGPGPKDGGDVGIGPYGVRLDPGIDDFYGWNEDSPSLAKSGADGFVRVGNSRGLPGQPVITLSAKVKVSISEEAGRVIVRPLIQVRNLNAQSVSTLSFVFLSGSQRYHTEPLTIRIPARSDCLVGEHLEFDFVRFPSDQATLDLAIDRVEFQHGKDWTWGFLTSSCEADTAPQPIQKAHGSYTEAAANHHTSGRITMKVLVGTDGRVVWVYLMRGLPWGLNEKGVRAALAIAFQPATVHGRATSCWADLAIPFFAPRRSSRITRQSSNQYGVGLL
jgi:hypothetical protein